MLGRDCRHVHVGELLLAGCRLLRGLLLLLLLLLRDKVGGGGER